MRAVVVIVFVILVILLSIVAYRRRGVAASRSLRLTPEAVSVFTDYIRGSPAALAREQRCSGIADIIATPAQFFARELLEPEHADIAASVDMMGGVVGVTDMREWIGQNQREIERNIVSCEPHGW